MLTFLYQIHPANHNDVNVIKPGSKWEVTDKHAAEFSKTACLDINQFVYDV